MLVLSLMPSLGEWPLVSFLDQSRRYGNETNAQVVEVIRSPRPESETFKNEAPQVRGTLL